MRLAVPLLVAFATAACGRSEPRAPSQLLASDVMEVAALPPGYQVADQLSESCAGRRGFRAIRNEPLADVDCSVERVSRALRARAAERHSPYLVEKSCRVRGRERLRVSCTAKVVSASSSVALAAPLERDAGPAPSAGRVLDLDEPRPQHSRQIRVSFVPNEGARSARLRPRAYDRVAETREPAPGRAELGRLSARCDDCAPLALHHALRVTAGRVGAGEVSDVRCFADEGQQRCVATALEPWTY